jgi:hypothetical protein
MSRLYADTNTLSPPTHLRLLVDRLEKEYGPDHPVIHYVAPALPHELPLKQKYTISELYDPVV